MCQYYILKASRNNTMKVVGAKITFTYHKGTLLFFIEIDIRVYLPKKW